MIDYAAVLEELEQQRAKLDTLIGAVREMLLVPPPRRNGKGPTNALNVDRERRRQNARRMWDNGIPAAEIAKQLGVTPTAVRGKKDKWPAQAPRG